MSELHLDKDEWKAIYESLINHRDSEQERAHRDYLDSIVRKVGRMLRNHRWLDVRK